MTMLMITNQLSFIFTVAVVLTERRWRHSRIQKHKVRPQVCCGLHSTKSAHGLWSSLLPYTVRSTATGHFQMNPHVVLSLLIFLYICTELGSLGCNVFAVQFSSVSKMTLSQVSLCSAPLFVLSVTCQHQHLQLCNTVKKQMGTFRWPPCSHVCFKRSCSSGKATAAGKY